MSAPGTTGRSVGDPQSATVLLADDDADFRETLTFWLSTEERWEPVEASNGEEALNRLDDTVDLLVLDRKMPAASGGEVIDRVDDTAFEGPVIVLSAFEANGHLEGEAIADYATKPIDREGFLDLLERNL